LEQIRYTYRLVGVDKDWIYLNPGENKAFYNKLSKGDKFFIIFPFHLPDIQIEKQCYQPQTDAYINQISPPGFVESQGEKYPQGNQSGKFHPVVSG